MWLDQFSVSSQSSPPPDDAHITDVLDVVQGGQRCGSGDVVLRLDVADPRVDCLLPARLAHHPRHVGADDKLLGGGGVLILVQHCERLP